MESDDDINIRSYSDLAYRVKRGYMVIFNNVWFSNNAPTRNGAGEEGNDMKELFERLGFTVEKRVNQTKNEMVDFLKVLSQEDSLSKFQLIFKIREQTR